MVEEVTEDREYWKNLQGEHDVYLEIRQAQIDMEVEQDLEAQKLKTKIHEESLEERFAREHEVMDVLREAWGLTWEEIEANAVNIWEDVSVAASSLSHTVAGLSTSVIIGAKSAKEAAKDLLTTVLSMAIQTLIQIGVQKLILAAIEKTTVMATIASIVAANTAIAASAAPAAILNSIASYGAAAAIGTAAFSAATATMTGISTALMGAFNAVAAGAQGAAAFAEGGIVVRPTFAMMGEEGAEAIIPLRAGRRREALGVPSSIMPTLSGGGGYGGVNVAVTFAGDVKLDADMNTVRKQLGRAVEDAIRSAQ